jgi:hypothetical protein
LKWLGIAQPLRRAFRKLSRCAERGAGLTFRIERYEKPNRCRSCVMRCDLYRMTPVVFGDEDADEEILAVDSMLDGIEVDGSTTQVCDELLGGMTAQFGTAPQCGA